MQRKGNLAIATVRALSRYLAEQAFDGWRLRDFVSCDFAVLTDQEVTDDLELLRDEASGWYGIHSIDAGFEGDMTEIIVGYYGLGALSFCTLWDEMDDAGVSPRDRICKTILRAMNIAETVTEDSILIIEFAEEA